jgi:hypothetical protein
VYLKAPNTRLLKTLPSNQTWLHFGLHRLDGLGINEKNNPHNSNEVEEVVQ